VVNAGGIEVRIDSAMRTYLSRPEDANALAHTCVERARSGVVTDELGWAYLARGLAQCRLIQYTPDEPTIAQDFARAAQIFRVEKNQRGQRLAELGPAAIAMRMGRWPEAVREFEGLIGRFDLNGLDADNFYLCFGLATSYVYVGRLEESLRFGYAALHLAEQLDLSPEFAAAAMPVGVALMAAKAPEEAASFLETAIAAAERAESPSLAKVLRNNRAVALRRLGRLPEAAAEVKRVLADNSPMVGGQHFVHYNAAELALQFGEIEQANAQLDIARKLLQAQGASGLDLIKLRYVEGVIFRRRQQLDFALEAFRAVEKMLPEVSALRFHERAEFYDEMADVLAQLGQPNEAFLAQRASTRHYQSSVLAANSIRQFSMQIRQEMQRVARDLERVSQESKRLHEINRELRDQVDRSVSEATRLRDQASLDGLTGVFNRRYLDGEVPSLLQRSRQAATPFSMVMIDLDHFKRINDVHGHAVGDDVLVRFCELARQSLRGSDVVGRYGGEEFYIALVGCGAAAATQRIGSLMQRFQSQAFAAHDHSLAELSFSAGIAVYPEDGTDVGKLIDCADRRLLQAKTEGRARIVGRETSVS
jgi:two-component system, cell cycle response regulator